MTHFKYRVASSLGPQYMIPQSFANDSVAAHRFVAMQNELLKGLAGVDTVRVERQSIGGDWEPVYE